ncbi:EamA/RhaT family transporter, partial [Klebsiella pneumoniae]
LPLPLGRGRGVLIRRRLATGVPCSGGGAQCGNIASQRLPTVILGPLIVFETLAGLLYTFLLRQSLPPLLTLSGILLLVLGVVSAVRARPEKPMLQPLADEKK